MTPEQLDELERLSKAANLDRLESTHIISPGYTHMANLTEVIGEPGSMPSRRGRCLAMLPKGWADWIAAIDNAADSLIADARRLRKLEAAALRVVAIMDSPGPVGSPEEYRRMDDALLELRELVRDCGEKEA